MVSHHFVSHSLLLDRLPYCELNKDVPPPLCAIYTLLALTLQQYFQKVHLFSANFA